MHVAFAQSNPHVESIETLGTDAITQFAESAHVDLDTACSLMDGQEGDRLRQRRNVISEHLGELNSIDHTLAIDTHGDFHVGQILKSPTDQYFIVDFDGSPVLAPQERLKKQPAARDIAGMLASIDHVARVVNYRTEGLEPHAALIWSAHAQEAFLLAYMDVLRQHDLLKILDERLLKPFMLHQELREYIYSARHLPHWRYVPDSVITSMFPAKDLDEGVI
jgi:maltokinase